MKNKAFIEGKEVMEQLERYGFEAYFVGGCVRDSLLNKEVSDIDIATSATPEEVQAIFPKTIPVGLEHGTVIVIHNGVSYEITTFRQDGDYLDQRHPNEVTYVKKIEEDLKRRDFTINSLAINSNGKLIDLFGGRQDLENKLIRTVGNPDDRFHEDPLRIVRALRFSSQLGFDIHVQTLDSMKRLHHEIATVAVERLTNEFTRFFKGAYVNNGLKYLLCTNVHHYLPIFKEHHDLIKRLPSIVSPFESFAEVITMFHYFNKTVTLQDWVKAWKCSNQTKREAQNLSEALNYFKEKGMDDWLVYRLHRPYFQAFIHLLSILFEEKISFEQLCQWKDNLPIQSRDELAINGHDLLTLLPNVKRGPWMSELLETIERKIILREIENTKTVIKEWILCHPPEIN